MGSLAPVETIPTVSGGSITATFLADRLARHFEPGGLPADTTGPLSPAWDRDVAEPFRSFCRRDVRTGPLLERLKIVADVGSGEVLGGHFAGPAAGEMIHVLVAAMTARATMTDLADAIYAYPTFAPGVRGAAREWVNTRRQSQSGGSPEGLAEERGGTRR